MKRNTEAMAMADRLMTSSLAMHLQSTVLYPTADDSSSPCRIFECMTCNRQFQSFQALGGHRASHKKPRLVGGEPAKPKTHECSICGLEFAVGQALGGHMRRHRAHAPVPSHYNRRLVSFRDRAMGKARRVLCLDLDLNLTPVEDDVEFRPLLDLF